MLQSFKRYIKYFALTLFTKKERSILFRDFISYFITKSHLKQKYSRSEKELALQATVNWLLQTQKCSGDAGFGTYRTIEGWTSSYPETSGYILSTLISFLKFKNKPELSKNVTDCADWLLSIQKPHGGWQSGYVLDNKPEVVFNTGQVIRGLLDVYQYTCKKTYLNSAKKACDWLCSIQEEDGSWKKFAFMNQQRVYDSYVAQPLLTAYGITGNENYRKAALSNLNWIILKKQHPNGWFEDCDNTIKHNHQPITHTLGYTTDGLLESGILLKEERFILAAKKTADKLLEIYNQEGFLKGRYDSDWNGSEYMVCTGSAQLAIVWLKLYGLYKNEAYLYAASKMNNTLAYIQNTGSSQTLTVKGAIPGSFPFWGKYEPFAFPNWASKYFADSLMLELSLTEK